VITVGMSTVIQSPPKRVWRALTVPEEVIRWDERIVSLREPAPDYPSEGRAACWRYRLGALAVDLHDRPLEVVPPQRLRTAVALGLFRFEETWTLDASSDSARTRLALRIVSSNSVPLVGGLLDRFAVRSMASERVDAKLRAVRAWCEGSLAPQPVGAAARP
jgi:uncharacterized protein YndB with AHSA1/START domain